MKNLLLSIGLLRWGTSLILFLSLAICMDAQIFLSGNVSYLKGDLGPFGDLDIKSAVALTPRIGYAFNNWVLGFDAGIQKVKYSSELTSNKGWQLGVFGRRIKKINTYFGLWAEVQLQYGQSKLKSEFSKADIYRQSAIIRPGVLFFLNKHLSMEASFGNVGILSSGIDAEMPNFPSPTFKAKTNQYGLNLNRQSAQFAVNWLF